MDVEIELRFLATFFAALLLLQALVLLTWVTARGVRRGLAVMRRVPVVEPTQAPTPTVQPTH